MEEKFGTRVKHFRILQKLAAPTRLNLVPYLRSFGVSFLLELSRARVGRGRFDFLQNSQSIANRLILKDAINSDELYNS